MSDNKLPFIPGWIDDAGLKPVVFRLYCHLRRCADNEDGIAFPSYEAMMRKCGVSRKTIYLSLQELEERSFISRDGKPFGGSCRYRVLAPNSVTTGTIEPLPIVSPGNCNRSPSDPSIVSPRAREGKPKKVNQKKVNQSGSLFGDDILPFTSDAFREAWNQWQQHRKEKRNPLTPTSIRSQFRKFTAWGEAASIASITRSIENGWTGIFEPSGNQAKPAQPAPAGKTYVNGQFYKTS